MAELERANRDLTSGNLIKKILIYFIPLFLSNALQLLFTTVDLLTVAHFGGGNNSTGAIGATNNIINLILCVFWGVTGGVAVVVANAKGAHDKEKAFRAIGSSIILMFIAGIVVMIFGIIFSKQFLILLNTDSVFLEKSTQYLTVYFIGAPFNLMYATGAAILRASGDTKRPFYAIVISGVTNIILDLLLVIVFDMDVVGVAIATAAAECVSMVIVFYYILRGKYSVNFPLKYLKVYKEETFDILRIGLASGLQGFIFNFTNVLVQKCTNELGQAAVIAKAASSNIEGYEYGLLNAISQTCLVAVSQNYGAMDKKRMKQSLFICTVMQLAIVTAFDATILLLNRPLLSLFIRSGEETTAEATALALKSLIIVGLPYALCGVPENFSGYLRGMKYSIVPTIVSLICIVGARLFFIFVLFQNETFHNFTSLISVYPISWCLCILLYIPTSIILSKRKFKQMDNKLTESKN